MDGISERLGSGMSIAWGTSPMTVRTTLTPDIHVKEG